MGLSDDTLGPYWVGAMRYMTQVVQFRLQVLAGTFHLLGGHIHH